MSTSKNFQVVCQDSECKARITKFQTKTTLLETPLFLPVGTLGVVKTLSYEELRQLGVFAFIANTYHLYFRPGIEVLKSFGCLHHFINWDRAIFTDSGGYQVFSLRELKKITEDGVEFKSHLDGSLHFFSPEYVIELQDIIGSDIALCLDECVEYPAQYEYVKRSVELTTKWARRSKIKHEQIKSNGSQTQLLFGIVQGSVFKDLRKKSLEDILEIGFDGYAFGGFSVGEPRDLLVENISFLSEFLPPCNPRYIMGIGEVEDIWNCIQYGFDIMDCVLPTRNGRNGQAITTFGKLNIKNAQNRNCDEPLDKECECFVCKNYSRALLHHYFKSGELLAMKLLSYHNLYFINKVFEIMKRSIKEKKFLEEKRKFLERYYSED